MRNNPVNNVDPDGHDCVYLNDTGNDAESVDNHSSPAECQATGGAWADGTITNVTTDPNSNNILIQTAQREDNGNIGYVTTETAPGQWSPGTELDQVAAGVNALRPGDFIAAAAAGSTTGGAFAGGLLYGLFQYPGLTTIGTIAPTAATDAEAGISLTEYATLRLAQRGMTKQMLQDAMRTAEESGHVTEHIGRYGTPQKIFRGSNGVTVVQETGGANVGKIITAYWTGQ